MYAKEFGANPW